MPTSRTIAWVVWMIASVFYAYQYILRVMPSIMLGDIMQQFHIDAAVFGQFSGIYYLGYALMHLPIGIMLDRYGPKRVMTGCILLTVMGTLPIIYAENWLYLLIGRVMVGAGSSAAILGAFKIIRMTFSEQHFTRMLSFSVTIGLIGAIYGGGPLGYMCASLGYKAVVQIFAVVGVALAACTYLIVPQEKAAPQGTIFADIKTVLGNRQVLWLCCAAGLMVGPLEGFADVWGAIFLKQVYGFDAVVSSTLPSLVFMGMCFGAPALSIIAEKTGRYMGVIVGSGILMFLAFAALVAEMLTVSSITVSFILIGVCSAYQILAIYKASTYVPDHVAGLTTALANMIIMSFGYGFHTVMGFIIHAYGGPTSAQALVYGIDVIPAALGIGTLGCLALAYCDKRKVDNAVVA
jgi:predicted MFS family arabinose efflux permease